MTQKTDGTDVAWSNAFLNAVEQACECSSENGLKEITRRGTR